MSAATYAAAGLAGEGLQSRVLSLLASFGWPVLRGDVSDLSPVSRQDALETGGEGNSSKSGRPSRSFVTGLLAISVIALAAGIGLILLQP